MRSHPGVLIFSNQLTQLMHSEPTRTKAYRFYCQAWDTSLKTQCTKEGLFPVTQTDTLHQRTILTQANTRIWQVFNRSLVQLLPIQNSLEFCSLLWGPNPCPADKSTCICVVFTGFLLLINPELEQNLPPLVLQKFHEQRKSNCNYQHWLK